MKPDIINRKDIENLVNLFYDKIKTDQVIGYFFNDVVKIQWEKHLPVMYDFWENILFHTGNYKGNPMEKHKKIHALSKLDMKHFQHWIKIFNETVDEHFEGKNALLIKQRALSIATVMQIHIFGHK